MDTSSTNDRAGYALEIVSSRSSEMETKEVFRLTIYLIFKNLKY